MTRWYMIKPWKCDTSKQLENIQIEDLMNRKRGLMRKHTVDVNLLLETPDQKLKLCNQTTVFDYKQ